MRIILAFTALLIPGMAWWAWLGRRTQDPLLSLAQISGVSFSLLLLFAELVFIFRGKFSTVGILILLGLLALLAALGIFKKGVNLPKKFRPHLVVGVVLFGLVIAWRLTQAQTLLLPNWVDSQHHYLIIRTIIKNRGLPNDLSPALQVPFYYHYGFHALTALFTTLSGLEIGKAMLLLGQVLNAAVSLSIYALGKTLWNDWRPAAGGALLASFVTRMPAYYLSWGRYTLLTGLVLIPLAIAASLKIHNKSKPNNEALSLAILTSGVLLSHFFTAILLASFLILLGLVILLSGRRQFRTALTQVAWIGGSAVAGLALSFPWLARVIRFSWLNAGIQSNLPKSLETVLDGSGSWGYIWKLLGPESSHWLLIPAFIGLLVTLVRNKNLAFGLWCFFLILLSLPWTFSFQPFRADHFAIVAFLPVALWASWQFWQLALWSGKWLKKRWIATLIMIALVGVWILWGFPQNADIINPVTVLVTQEDIDALEWVKVNTPDDARFFINTIYWQNSTYRGSDGGGWLLPITERWALVPTVFYGFSPDIKTRTQLRQWGENANTITTCSGEFWQLVNEANLDWIYIHEGKGSLQPEGLANCEDIREVYTNKGVRIYQISP